MSNSISNSKFVALTYTITDETDEVLERIDVPITYIQGRDSYYRTLIDGLSSEKNNSR